jgi:hypothetical protein
MPSQQLSARFHRRIDDAGHKPIIRQHADETRAGNLLKTSDMTKRRQQR